jgi:hypothetical protein
VQRCTRHHALPGDAGEREVFADRARRERMAFGLQRVNQLE